jgi:hypothetical protein
MSGSRAASDVQVKELDEVAGSDLFDRICQREMGISGSEFLQRWDKDEYADTDVDAVPGLADVVMVLPLVRD